MMSEANVEVAERLVAAMNAREIPDELVQRLLREAGLKGLNSMTSPSPK